MNKERGGWRRQPNFGEPLQGNFLRLLPLFAANEFVDWLAVLQRVGGRRGK